MSNCGSEGIFGFVIRFRIGWSYQVAVLRQFSNSSFYMVALYVFFLVFFLALYTCVVGPYLASRRCVAHLDLVFMILATYGSHGALPPFLHTYY